MQQQSHATAEAPQQARVAHRDDGLGCGALLHDGGVLVHQRRHLRVLQRVHPGVEPLQQVPLRPLHLRRSQKNGESVWRPVQIHCPNTAMMPLTPSGDSHYLCKNINADGPGCNHQQLKALHKDGQHLVVVAALRGLTWVCTMAFGTVFSRVKKISFTYCLVSSASCSRKRS